MLTLTINHLIHLSNSQRQDLHAGKRLRVVGVSVPVWILNDKTTSEPAQEVFCQYILSNTKKNNPIRIMNAGYEINLPYRLGENSPLSDNEWRFYKTNDPRKLDAWYKQMVEEVTSKCLLNAKEGGSGSLIYRETSKIQKDDKTINLIHYVCIETMESLIESLNATNH